LLEAPRYSSDGAFISWPVIDSVDFDTKEYGVGKCGPKAVVIYDEFGNQPDYLSFNYDLGAIELHPDMNSPIGLYTYTYVVVMVDYDYRSNSQPFDAAILECVVTGISSNGAYIESLHSTWGDDAVTVFATDAINSYTMYPDCGYDLVFTPKLVNADGSFAPLVPYSIAFEHSLDQYYFTFEKCS